ncbi:class I tRNA ligase family protein [Candidatus Mycoplasma haematohominis]|uniref:class I tRNA ligase family protein n=1 Tax=Candidatus Mycoplasma haematohominis TaxID=1494318 RepID=UPI001FEB6960|nr:class I tRNA ligase family protein [Candidatus Mycoplasma haemohominis]
MQRKEMDYYVPQDVEKKWIDIWEKEGTYKFEDDDNPKKLYILDMFPYPSGAGLHVGHLKGYLSTDILTRFYTMKGYLVFHPMGWDAFGLPAEQYAIKTGNSPAEFTKKNIDSFRKQLKKLMLTYDFDREIDTSDPNYYKHTQWIFSEMYERGLAVLQDTQVNWCEELNTVLSDEELVEEGTKLYSERGHHPVEKKIMKQWILKITKYADQLLEDIASLSWPDNVKKIQQSWIGKSTKYEYKFEWAGKTYSLYLKYASSIRKLKGIGIHQFSQISKDLEISNLTIGNKELVKGIELVNLDDYKKVDVFYLWDIDFRADELIPIFDQPEEDFYDEELERQYTKNKRLEEKKTVYKLKDWVFSRQRFWGEPIPIYFDSEGIPYLDKDLPVVLPTKVDYNTKRNGKSPLANDAEWLNIKKDGKQYTRETNTMPNWAGSSWYFIAYLLKKPDGTYHHLNSPEAKKILKRWLPVDIYVGGQEHAALHLLYARFWHKFLLKIGVVDTPEPFRTLLNQGMVLGADGTKMSKSKGNYVCIDEIVDKYGADSLRVYEAFSGPTQLSFKWEDSGLKSSHKWLHKIFIFFSNLDELEEVTIRNRVVAEIENKLIKNVENAIPNLKINLGISEMMIFMNSIQSVKKYNTKSLNSFIKILSLYAPALAEEIWTTKLHNTESLYKSKWPTINEIGEDSALEFRTFLNGKFKFSLKLHHSEMEEQEIKNIISSRLNIPDLDLTIMQDKKIILVHPRTAEDSSLEPS